VLPLQPQNGQMFAALEMSAGGYHRPVHLHHHTIQEIQNEQSSI
jgi:hypothetical protein